MNNQMFVPVKFDENALMGFQKVFKELALKVVEDVESGYNIKPYMNKKEAAEYIGVSFNTLKKFEREGLPVIEVDGVMLIKKSDIDEFLDSYKK